MTTLTNSAEGGTSGTTVTAANSGGASGSAFDSNPTIGTGCTFAFDNTHAAHGALSFKNQYGSTAGQVFAEWAASMGTQSKVWFRFYLYLTAYPGTTFRIWSCAPSSGICGGMLLTTAGKLEFEDSAGSVQLTSVSTVPLNTWFRVEGFLTGSATAGQEEFRAFYAMDATSADEVQTSGTALNTNSASIIKYDFGDSGTAVATIGPYWADDLGLSSTAYTGPAATGTGVQPVGTPSAPVSQSGNNTGSVTGSFSATQPRTAGDLLVAVVTAFGSSSAGAISTPAGWTQRKVVTAGGISEAAIYTKVAAGADAAPNFTATMTGTASHALMTCTLYEFTGQSGITPVLDTGSATGTTGNVTAAGSFSGPAGSVAITGYCYGSGTSGTLTHVPGSAGFANVATTGATSTYSHAVIDVAYNPSGIPSDAATHSGTATTEVAAVYMLIQPPAIYGGVRSPSATGHPSDAFANSVTAGSGARLPVGGRSYGNVKAQFQNAPPSYSAGQPAGVRVVSQRTGSTQATFVTPPAAAPPPPAVIYPPQRAVAAQGRGFPRRGACRTNISVPVQLTGPPLTPLRRPAQARQPFPPRGGRTQARAGVLTPVAPALATFYPLSRPAAAVTRPPAARGRTEGRSGAFQGTGSQFYPLRHPVAAIIRPLAAKGRTYSRGGIFSQLGPVFRPFLRPVAAVIRPLPIRGRNQSLAGQQQGTGAPLTQLRRPVQARLPLPARGRAQGRNGTFTAVGFVQATFYPLDRPAAAVIRPQPIRGRTSSRAGTYDQAGPQFYALNRPVQARRPLPPRGTAQWRYGTFSPITFGSPFYPLRHPVAAVRTLTARGRNAGRAGIYGQPGPAVTPLQRPVRAHPSPPPRGTAQGRAGTFTPAAVTAPFYPLSHPVQARQPLPVRGRVTRNAGVSGQTGPKLYPLQRAVRARLPQQPPPKGQVHGNPGVFDQAGPQLTPLRGPVRAAFRYLPPRGRAQGRAGTYSQAGPPVKPLQHPVYAWRPGPRRGICLTSIRPAPPVPYIEATFYPLRRPVQARRPLPPHGRTLTTPPYVPPGAEPANFVMTAWSPRTAWQSGDPAAGWEPGSVQSAWQAGDLLTTWEAGAPSTAWQDGSPSQT